MLLPALMHGCPLSPLLGARGHPRLPCPHALTPAQSNPCPSCLCALQATVLPHHSLPKQLQHMGAGSGGRHRRRQRLPTTAAALSHALPPSCKPASCCLIYSHLHTCKLWMHAAPGLLTTRKDRRPARRPGAAATAAAAGGDLVPVHGQSIGCLIESIGTAQRTSD